MRKEIIVRPGGSVLEIRYWSWSIFTQRWQALQPEEPWPRYAKVETIVKEFGQSVAPTSGALEPEVAAVAESTVVALFAGGTGSDNGFATREAVLYDPTTQTGTALEMVEARSGQTMTRLTGNRILIAGGYSADVSSVPLASAEIFSLSGQAFAATGSLGLGRGSHAASPLPDGRVLVTGGLILQGAGPATVATATTEIFDPATGAFTTGPSMATERFNHSQVSLADGRILVLGGNGLRSAEVYSPSTNQFAPVEDMAERHGLGHVAVRLANGQVLVTGGDSTFNIQPTATVEQFDPATDQFTTVGQMTSPRMLHFAVLQDDGQVLIGGGRGADGSDLATAELYSPTSHTFTPVADLPAATSDQPGAFVTAPE